MGASCLQCWSSQKRLGFIELASWSHHTGQSTTYKLHYVCIQLQLVLTYTLSFRACIRPRALGEPNCLGWIGEGYKISKKLHHQSPVSGHEQVTSTATRGMRSSSILSEGKTTGVAGLKQQTCFISRLSLRPLLVTYMLVTPCSQLIFSWQWCACKWCTVVVHHLTKLPSVEKAHCVHTLHWYLLTRCHCKESSWVSIKWIAETRSNQIKHN